MPRHIQRRDVLKGTGALGIAGVAGCLGNGDDDDVADDTADDTDDDGDGDPDAFEATVGILSAETGDLGTLGGAIGDAAQLAAEQITDADVPVEVDYQRGDTQTDPQAGISETESLVGAGYEAIVGPNASNVNLQVTREVMIPNEVVGMSPSSTAPAVTDLDDDGYIFRTAPSDALQGPVMADVAIERLGVDNTATIFLNDDYGQALEQSYVDAFEERGGEVLDRVPLEPEQPSYTSNWAEALENDPDLVMIVAFPVSGTQLFIDYYGEFADDHPDLEILVPDGLIDDDLPDEVDNDFAEFTGTAPATAGPGAEFFAEEYNARFDRSPGPFNAQAYDAMAVIVLAQAYAGETDGTSTRDNIREVANPNGDEVTPENLADGVQMALDGEDINYAGASSSVDFDDNGDMQAVSYDIMEVEDRNFVSIDRIDFEN